MKIAEVSPGSPLFGYVRPGYSVLSVNGHKVQDSIDWRFRIADERVKIMFADPNGQTISFQFDDLGGDGLGIVLDDHKVKTCKNDCIFCFIRQQPQGMRRALYVKDEDYRLSFTHGNFITLSNITEEDLTRIVEQRLSPMYVSVHATDDKLRRCMLKNERLAPIIPRLKYLAENGISIHTQVVLCPGVNDGPQLKRTIDDLVELYPAVETLAAVPVGLTKYRERLPNLRNYTPDEAATLINYVEERQRDIMKQNSSRFVWCADEFYVIAGRQFPPRASYEEMNQFENGIGMAREFIAMFNRRRAKLKGLASDKRILLLTGFSAIGFLKSEIIPYLRGTLGLNVDVQPVVNRFWGETVTVSGLLTGQDLLRHSRSQSESFDVVVLPPNCLNSDDLFLDNLSLEHFQKALKKPVLIGQYNLAATIREACV